MQTYESDNEIFKQIYMPNINKARKKYSVYEYLTFCVGARGLFMKSTKIVKFNKVGRLVINKKRINDIRTC